MPRSTLDNERKEKLRKRREKRKERDPNAPKRPQSAYMLWANEFRTKYVEEHTEMKSKVAEVAKIAGAKWREMDDGEKAPYLQRYKELRDQYVEEQKEYNIINRAYVSNNNNNNNNVIIHN